MASTTDKLAGALAAKQQGAVAQAKPQGLIGLITSDNFKKQMALAIPKTLTVDRFTRLVVTEMRKNPKLTECTPVSFLGSVMQLAQLGLEPTSLGHAYLIPFYNGRAKAMECQAMIGYKGMLDLARRSGQILTIFAYCVHENDEFEYRLGLDPDIKHVPSSAADRGKVTHVYAVAKLKDGGVQFEVMSTAEVERIRQSSKAGNSGPWVSHWDEMAKKTVIRRLFKYLPISIEAQRAVETDEKMDRGESTSYADALDGVYVDKGVDLDSGEVLPAEPAEPEQAKEPLPDLCPD